MNGRHRTLRGLISRFGRRDDGTATVEAVLWLPVFLAVFGLMVDSAILFHGQSKVLRVVQDANRRFSIQSLKTEAEVISYINSELNFIGVTPSATNSTSNATTGVVTTAVSVPASELQMLGFFSALSGLTISVTAQHMRENWTG